MSKLAADEKRKRADRRRAEKLKEEEFERRRREYESNKEEIERQRKLTQVRRLAYYNGAHLKCISEAFLRAKLRMSGEEFVRGLRRLAEARAERERRARRQYERTLCIKVFAAFDLRRERRRKRAVLEAKADRFRGEYDKLRAKFVLFKFRQVCKNLGKWVRAVRGELDAYLKKEKLRRWRINVRVKRFVRRRRERLRRGVYEALEVYRRARVNKSKSLL